MIKKVITILYIFYKILLCIIWLNIFIYSKKIPIIHTYVYIISTQNYKQTSVDFQQKIIMTKIKNRDPFIFSKNGAVNLSHSSTLDLFYE